MSMDDATSNPELVIGLVGPIGVDLDAVIAALKEELQLVGYSSEIIRASELMKAIPVSMECRDSTYVEKYDDLIEYADRVRQKCKNSSALAGLSIIDIQSRRDKITAQKREKDGITATIPALGVSYIIRQFKRREEIELLRRTYGRKFIQVSVYLEKEQRTEVIANKIGDYDTVPRTREQCIQMARELIEKDYNEKEHKFGQRVEEVFHLGDVFVPGIGRDRINQTVRRFIRALFGDTTVSPTRDEYGMYIAAAASLRSADLSRQIGAAIFSRAGEVITMGSNEVPRANGGTYWVEDGDPHRDIDEGSDANHRRKLQILHDFVDRLISIQVIPRRDDVSALVRSISSEDLIRDSQLMDIIEFGRMIHAEMSAISDAARLGRPTKGGVLFSTAFPCHMCAKHIVAAGLSRVVFLEPYPKSYAEQLHEDSITFNAEVTSKVLFEPFIGISPRRYRDIFEKGRRKDDSGKRKDWYESAPSPRIEDKSAAYLQNETSAIASSLAEVYGDLAEKTRQSTQSKKVVV